jgi:hypothetical protein
MMKYALAYFVGALLLLWAAATWGNADSDTVNRFRNAGEQSAVPTAFTDGSCSLPV